MNQPATTQRSAHLSSVANGYLETGALADAIVALDRALNSQDGMDAAARDLCERAAIDPADTAAVHELLASLSTRLAEMGAGQANAFETALQAWAPEERFSLPALAEVLWPVLDNLRMAGRNDATAYARELQRYEPQLKALYHQSSGRSEAAWLATWEALTTRLPGIFARHAAVLSAQESGLLQRVLQTPEGVGVVCGALGLLTLRMPVPTPLVVGSLALVGYAGIAPVLERLRAHLRNAIVQSLKEEDAAIARLVEGHAPLRLTEVIEDVRPVLMNAVLAGQEDPEQLRRHAQPMLARLRDACLAPGGPGAAYADAVIDVIRNKYIPRFSQAAVVIRGASEAPALRRALLDPRGAGLATMLATAPISILAAEITPWGMWDAPLMMGLFYGAGHLLSRALHQPRRQLDQLDANMAAEESVLAGLFAPPPAG